jgi:hypothetical protein
MGIFLSLAQHWTSPEPRRSTGRGGDVRYWSCPVRSCPVPCDDGPPDSVNGCMRACAYSVRLLDAAAQQPSSLPSPSPVVTPADGHPCRPYRTTHARVDLSRAEVHDMETQSSSRALAPHRLSGGNASLSAAAQNTDQSGCSHKLEVT